MTFLLTLEILLKFAHEVIKAHICVYLYVYIADCVLKSVDLRPGDTGYIIPLKFILAACLDVAAP